MKVIVKPRQAGKTEELLELAVEHFAYIVCPTMSQVQYLWDRARDAGITSKMPMPISFDEFVSGRYRAGGIKAFIIDDLDLCIQQMTRVPVIAVSLTG